MREKDWVWLMFFQNLFSLQIYHFCTVDRKFNINEFILLGSIEVVVDKCRISSTKLLTKSNLKPPKIWNSLELFQLIYIIEVYLWKFFWNRISSFREILTIHGQTIVIKKRKTDGEFYKNIKFNQVNFCTKLKHNMFFLNTSFNFCINIIINDY